MKALNKALVLATVTLMSASAFAADGTGATNTKDCAASATKDGDKQQKSNTASSGDEGSKPAKAETKEAK